MELENLFNEKSDNNVEYDKMLFDQYKLYVELTDRISQRRSNANSFFVTVNTALLAVTSWIHDGLGSYIIIVSAVGILFSLFWFFLINSYKQLNSGKFKVIHEIEKKLPLNLFSYEWIVLGSGKSRKKYWPLSHIERIVPIVFAVLYLILALLISCNI